MLKDFFINHWDLIVYFVIALISIVTSIILKRRPKIIDNSFVAKVTRWIKEAEDKYVQGSDKLDYVLLKAKENLGDDYVRYEVERLVEFLLELPQKKGVNKDER